MRIVCISDTHCAEPELPDGDLLIHAGDLTYRGRTGETKKQLDWLGSQASRYPNGVIVVPGNHEVDWEQGHVPFRRYCEERGLTVLVEEEVTINGYKIWGSPITPEFCGWAYMREPEDIDVHWKRIPDDTDILITHGPPRGILDKNLEGDRCGCPALKKRVMEVDPLLHVFGHIHEAYGQITTHIVMRTTWVNASIMNRSYHPVNEPKVIHLWKESEGDGRDSESEQ